MIIKKFLFFSRKENKKIRPSGNNLATKLPSISSSPNKLLGRPEKNFVPNILCPKIYWKVTSNDKKKN